MKKIIILMHLLVSVVILSFVTSCGEDEVEVVSQDTDWTIDSKYIEEDIREQMGIDPSKDFVYFGYIKNPFYTLEAAYDMEHVIITKGDTDMAVKVRITRPFEKDLTLRLVKGDEQFPVDVEGYTLMSESNFTSDTQVLKAGEREVTMHVSLKDFDAMSEVPGYVLALKLVMDGEYENLSVSQIRSTIFVKIDVIIRIDNIDSSNIPVDGTLLDNKTVLFETNTNPKNLYKLYDGNTYMNPWYPFSGGYLSMTFPEQTLLKSIKIDSSDLASLEVYVDKGDGIWLSHGKYMIKDKAKIVYVTFKKPTLCSKIRFDKMFTRTNGTMPDIYEINFIK